jgi:hypothetical protein
VIDIEEATDPAALARALVTHDKRGALTEIWSSKESTRERVLDYVGMHQMAYGRPPAVPQICAALGLPLGVVRRNLARLAAEGRVCRAPSEREYHATVLPVVLGRIS